MASKILETQFVLIREALELLSSEINRLEEIARKVPETDDFEKLKKEAFYHFLVRYLKNYRDNAYFLLTRAEQTSRKDMHFYLPVLRKIYDLFAFILFLVTESTERAIIASLIRRLDTISKIHRSKLGEGSLKKVYQQQIFLYSRILNDLKIVLPDDPADLTSKFIKKLKEEKKLTINNFQILNNLDFKRIAPETLKFFPKIERDPYNFYMFLSGYTHGEEILMNSIAREFLWIVSYLLMNTFILLESINSEFLSNENKNEILEILKRADQNRPHFVEYWKSLIGNQRKV